MKNTDRVISFKLFMQFSVLGLIAGVLCMGILSLVIAKDRRSQQAEREYMADFYGILQGEQQYAVYNVNAEWIARAFLAWRSGTASRSLPNIALEHAAAVEQKTNSIDKIWIATRGKVLTTGSELKWFEDVRGLVESSEFKRLAVDPTHRAQIKRIIAGEEIPRIAINISFPSYWDQVKRLALVSQMAVGICFFAFLLRNNRNAKGGKHYCPFSCRDLHESKCKRCLKPYLEKDWWRLPWLHFWPFFVLPVMLPGAAPIFVVASILSVWFALARRVREQGGGVSDREWARLPADDSLVNGDALLQRLTAKMRR